MALAAILILVALKVFSQSNFNFLELNKIQNPYSIVVPNQFYYNFYIDKGSVRKEAYKPSEELYEYYNNSIAEWQPSFKFINEYAPEGKLLINCLEL
jgi:hypothetical protein